MARVTTYLNFPGTTEAAFGFYRSVFGTEFVGTAQRFADVPRAPGQPPLPEAERALIMYIELPILGGHVLMGTDVTEAMQAAMGFVLSSGTAVSLNLEPDTLAEAQRLFEALSVGGVVEVALHRAFWGDQFGALVDRFGVRWLVNCKATD
jgi:PhnB protein